MGRALHVGWVVAVALGCSASPAGPDAGGAADVASRAAPDAAAPGSTAPSAALEVRWPGGQATLTPTQLAALPAVRATVDDPNRHARATYAGAPLIAVLKAAGADLAADATVVFHCADGYAAQTTVAQVERFVGLLAWQGGDGGPLPALPRHGGGTLDPGPFYALPTVPGATNAQHPWPYQVQRIEVVAAVGRAGRMAPPGASADGPVARGYRVFRGNCLACHAINGQGGAVGPDLNQPLNVTEYWRPAPLRRLLADPLSVRAGSKMPGFAHLGDAALDDVIAYLAFMKDHKVGPTR
jgi:mono/diheme cytochrome c family protein